MRLLETIVDENHRAVAAHARLEVPWERHREALPIVALTCIDVRLNHLLPDALGIPESQFIWLRNAGNIIFDSLSSMTRTLALACAIKGGREIVILGHTDCHAGHTTTSQLVDAFRALGIERARLPDNLTSFFGLFASERQNILRSVDFVRRSPLIGPRVPVHGLLLDVLTGRLEWVENGYHTLETFAARVALPPTLTAPSGERPETHPDES